MTQEMSAFDKLTSTHQVIPQKHAFTPQAGTKSSFVETNPADARHVTHLTSEPIDALPSLKLATLTYTVTHKDGTSKKQTYSIPFRPEQDVIDLILYSKDENNQLYVYVAEKIRPALTQRPALGLVDIAPSGKQINIPGFYYREDGTAVSIASKCQEFAESLGLHPIAKVQNLGAAYFADGHSPELILPRTLEVQESPFFSMTRYGSDFNGELSILKLTPEESLERFSKGQITDIRFIQALLRLCEKEEYPLAPQKTYPLHKVVNNKDCAIPIKTKQEARKLLQAVDTSISEVQKEESYTHHRKELTYTAQATLNRNDSTLNETFTFDVATRNPTDSLHGAPFFFYQGEPYFIVNIVERPVAVLRNEVAHQVYSNFGQQRIEGIFTRIDRDVAQSDFSSYLSSYFNKEWNLKAVESPAPIGFGTFSPGFDPHVGFFYLTQIDPTQTLEGPFKQNAFALSLDDLGNLIDSGDINSLELITSYTLACNALAVKTKFTPHAVDPDKEAKQELAEIFNGVSQTRQILAAQHPGVYSAMMSHPDGQKVIAYLQNETPGITFAKSKSAVEAGLFDGTLGLSPLDSEENNHENGILSFHDMMHAILRDPILRGMTFEEYRDALLRRESDALWFSEVKVPAIYGFDRYKHDTGKTSFGEVLENAGITDIHQQRLIIRKMVMEGIIDEQLARAPRYKEARWCIQEKLLGYYVRDYRTNCKILYDDKKDHPRLNKVLSLFAAPNPPTLEEVFAYPHAVNNLKEYTASLRSNLETLKSVSQLAAIIESVGAAEDKGSIAVRKEAWVCVTELSEAFQQLAEISQAIQSAEVNDQNLALYKRIKEIASEDGPFTKARKFCRYHYHGEREFPASKIHSFFTTPAQHKEVLRIEASQCGQYGLSLE